MDCDVLVDQRSVRRFRRRSLIFLLAFPLVFGGSPGRPLLVAWFGEPAGDRSAHLLMLTGIGVIFSSPLWGSRDVFFYRCPRCRRRLSKVSPQGVAEANIHYACEDCRIIWDLGWAWHGGGEGGG